jgi:hypothetical protein
MNMPMQMNDDTKHQKRMNPESVDFDSTGMTNTKGGHMKGSQRD